MIKLILFEVFKNNIEHKDMKNIDRIIQDYLP